MRELKIKRAYLDMSTEINIRQMTVLIAYKLKFLYFVQRYLYKIHVTIKIHKLLDYQKKINSFKKIRFKDSGPIRKTINLLF
jgi:hypothetical protein